MFNIRSQDILIGSFLLLVVLASGADLLTDLSHGATTSHLIQEIVVLLAALGGIIWLVLNHKMNLQKINELHSQLQDAKTLASQQTEEFKKAKKQLANIINDQFAQWQLTKSEQEVGRLLLKGFSLKEISMLRGVGEKTIRQQASAIYQKSGLSGRHEFAAWFLEDLVT